MWRTLTGLAVVLMLSSCRDGAQQDEARSEESAAALLNVGYQLRPRLRTCVGYNFLYWSDVVRPGDQIDLVSLLSPPVEGSSRAPCDVPAISRKDAMNAHVEPGS